MRDITLCHPRLQTLAAELIKECGKQGLQIKIGETLRTTGRAGCPVCSGTHKAGDYCHECERQQLQLLSSVGSGV